MSGVTQRSPRRKKLQLKWLMLCLLLAGLAAVGVVWALSNLPNYSQLLNTLQN